jgi:hypothetical protein
VLLLALATAASARAPDDPIHLDWSEGDVAGFNAIYAERDSRAIGSVQFHQQRTGDLLRTIRVARFSDGSSDEDEAVARIAGDRLYAVGGRSILRDRRGQVVVDLQIDVAAGRLTGFYLDDGVRLDFDETAALSAGTYWGPLLFLVLKNFAANAEDGRVRFRTVAPTPRPRVFTMELVESGQRTLQRPGGALDVERYMLRPVINPMIDPLLRVVLPPVEFLVDRGEPPALARFAGPRNYGGQEIRLE